MLSFLKVTEYLSMKDYLKLILLIISSMLMSYLMVNLIINIFNDELYFNIFNVMPILYWIGIFLLTLLPTAFIRPILLGIFAKLKFDKLYFKEMIFHIFKYGFFSLPFLIPVILILGNIIVLNIIQVSAAKTLFIGLLFAIVFFLIWVFFLGTTIVKFLRKKFSLPVSILINISTSVITTLIITSISFSYFTNIDRYELLFVKEAINSLQKTGKLSDEKAKCLLEKYNINRR